MPFEIIVSREFSAAHALRFPDGSLEPVHGHNWAVAVTVTADRLDTLGTVMDFHDLERLLDPILARLQNRHLNEVAPFDTELNPSAENVAFHVARSLRLPATVRLANVRVCETANCCAIYRPEIHHRDTENTEAFTG